MSSFVKETRHPRTGEWEMAHWIDDLFGRHRYGVVFPSDGDSGSIEQMLALAYNPDKTDLETRDPAPVEPRLVIAAPTPAPAEWDPVEEILDEATVSDFYRRRLDAIIARVRGEAVRKEREACAKVAEVYQAELLLMHVDEIRMHVRNKLDRTREREIRKSGHKTAEHIAAAIRARGSQP